MDDDVCNLGVEAQFNLKFVHENYHPVSDANRDLQYTDLQLFNQLRYFAYLFNGEKAKKSASGSTDLGNSILYPTRYGD
jgi:hypothetical protein